MLPEQVDAALTKRLKEQVMMQCDPSIARVKRQVDLRKHGVYLAHTHTLILACPAYPAPLRATTRQLAPRCVVAAHVICPALFGAV